ncbi:MAG: S1C family serine protease [Candidatus Polarisedimenticolia bacterium]
MGIPESDHAPRTARTPQTGLRPATAVAALLALLFGSGAAPPTGVPAAPSIHRPADPAAEILPPAVAGAFDSVVAVRVREIQKVPVYRGGRFRREPVEGLGAGSGVAVGPDLILTNAHVVAGSTEVRVALAGRRETAARVISVDEASDLALLRVEGETLRPVAFAAGPAPASGRTVYVLGNRGDSGPEVAWARMGGHRRVRAGTRPIEFWCEVEAPIGPGSSGGALLDERGELLGIPSLLVSYAGTPRAPTPSAGLFIPAAHLKRALRRMLQGPRADWPWIGLLVEDPLLIQAEGRAAVPTRGAVVRRILPGSPAATAGFLPGDRILAIAGRAVADHFEALHEVLDLEPGDRVEVVVERAGARLTILAETGHRPYDPRPDPIDDFLLHTGVRLRPVHGDRSERPALAFAGLSARARSRMPAFEAELFAGNPALVAIVPGQSVLDGRNRRFPVTFPGDLDAIVPRCFVGEQFVALLHWENGALGSIDRAHVDRKIYPVVL